MMDTIRLGPIAQREALRCKGSGRLLVLAGATVAVGVVVAAATELRDQVRLRGPDMRRFEFRYQVAVEGIPAGGGPLDIFIPLAPNNGEQTILERNLETPVKGQIRQDRLGNWFWFGTVDRSGDGPIQAAVTYVVERRPAVHEGLTADSTRPLTAEERISLAGYLAPNRRVPVAADYLVPIAAEVAPGEDNPLQVARAIYDYVIENMEYKKVGTGWGNGDTFWACSKRYGNCTDYHALFMSLARMKGVPARFEIGFPVPLDRTEGAIGGYHCWVSFYLPEVGWVPVDASEADKDPEKRELLFGTHPADRLYFTEGRDLELGQGHDTGPLNYFVYPHVELANRPYDRVTTAFRYRELARRGGGEDQGSARLTPVLALR